MVLISLSCFLQLVLTCVLRQSLSAYLLAKCNFIIYNNSMNQPSEIDNLLHQNELLKIKKKMQNIDSEFKRQKAILLQKIQLQDQKIQQLIERQQTQKKIYESVIKSYEMAEQSARRKLEELDYMKQQMQQMGLNNQQLTGEVDRLNKRLQQLEEAKKNNENELKTQIDALRTKLNSCDSQINLLNDMIESERRKNNLINQRQLIYQKQQELFTENSNLHQSLSYREDANLISSTSFYDCNKMRVEELSVSPKTQKMSALRSSNQIETKGKNETLFEKYFKDQQNFKYQEKPKQPIRSGVIMNVKDFNKK